MILLWTIPAAPSFGQRAVVMLSAPASDGWLRVALAQAPAWYAWAAMTPAIRWGARRFPIGRWRQLRVIGAHAFLCLASQLFYSMAYTASAYVARSIPPGFGPGRYFRVTLAGYLP